MLPRDKANKIVSVHILYSSMGAPKQIFFFTVFRVPTAQGKQGK